MNIKKTLFLGLILLSSTFLLSSCNQKTPDLDVNLQADEQESAQNTQNQDMNNQNPNQAESQKDYSQEKDLKVELKTSKGTMKLALFPQVAPITVNNFLNKATSGYYDGLIFHRVEDWVIQGGDPLGTGTGGGQIPTELSEEPFKEGSLGVARGGNIEISNDSQFFICIDDCAWLTGQYTVFGEVLSGMDIAKKTAIGDKILSITISSSETGQVKEKDVLAETSDLADDGKPIIYHSQTCSHCKVLLEHLEENSLTQNFTLKDVSIKANQDEMKTKAADCNLDTSKGIGVPFLFDSGKCIMGDQPIIDHIES